MLSIIKTKEGRSRNSWMQEVTTGMRKREREELAAWSGSTGRGGEGK